MTVYNLPRWQAKGNIFPFTDACWISIHEPCERDGSESCHIENEHLDKLPKLKIKFWDLTKPIVSSDNVTFNPPGPKQARRLVEFLVKNRGKVVVANCAAGVSRSGAVALFCVDMFSYAWDRESKQRAVPNMHLYRLMVDYYLKKYVDSNV